MATLEERVTAIEKTQEKHDDTETLLLETTSKILSHLINVIETQDTFAKKQDEHGVALKRLTKAQDLILETLQEHGEILKRIDPGV